MAPVSATPTRSPIEFAFSENGSGRKAEAKQRHPAYPPEGWEGVASSATGGVRQTPEIPGLAGKFQGFGAPCCPVLPPPPVTP